MEDIAVTIKRIEAARKAFDESELTDEQRAKFYKVWPYFLEGGASDKTIKNYFKAKIGPDIHRKNQAAEEAKNQKVTPAKNKTPVKKTKPINANIFGIPLGKPKKTKEEKTPVKKTKPEKTKELKTHELSRVYTKPSKVQEMHRRRRKGGKSFTRQGASKLIDKTDKITIYNMNKADKAVEIREVANEKGKKYEKDLTSGGSRGSALTATGGSRVEYENKPGDKPGKAWIKTSKIPSITKQMELYRQNRKRKKKGR